VGRWPSRLLAAGTGVAGALAGLVGGLVAGVGWLYLLRELGWFALGPRVGDSLPLLQLAGYDAQPLGRVVVAWLAAGLVAGLAVARMPRVRRLAVIGIPALVLLLLASQASFALARNVRLSDVVWSRHPGTGPWLEALLFSLGCLIPNLGLRRGKHRDAGQHEPDR
jgi:hypothetical protein